MKVRYLLSKLLKRLLQAPSVADSKIHPTARLDSASVVVHTSLGRYRYVGEHSSVLWTDVGNFTSISNYCAIGGGSHPVAWAAMSPVFYRSSGILKKKLGAVPYEPFAQVRIGNDVWIGSHCLIRGGVTIGDGAVIGMGSVVTKNVGDYEIWAGNPAQLIRRRFPQEQIDELLRERWWERSDAELALAAGSVENVSAFLTRLSQAGNRRERKERQ